MRASAIVQVYEAASLVCDIIGKGDHALKAARSLRRIMRTISLVALILVWMAGMGHTAPIVTVSSWSLRYVEPLVEAFNAKGLGIEAEAVQLRPDALKARLITNLAPGHHHVHGRRLRLRMGALLARSYGSRKRTWLTRRLAPGNLGCAEPSRRSVQG